MSSHFVRFGIPVKIETNEAIYHVGYTSYKKVSSAVWIDVGGECLIPHQYEVGMCRSGLFYSGSIQGFDVPAPISDWKGSIYPLIFEGEVVDPEPMDALDSDGDAVMEIKGEEDEFEFGPMASYSDYESDPPTPEESDPKELSSS
ncbi:uncharacterized protein J3R85_015739 [Psidium guajava]|nr:uncharacterized protein J3R85_015739 [Psidium guajava]